MKRQVLVSASGLFEGDQEAASVIVEVQDYCDNAQKRLNNGGIIHAIIECRWSTMSSSSGEKEKT